VDARPTPADVCQACGRPFDERRCLDCGHTFSLSAQQREWFMAKFGNLPERCPECRRQRREFKRSSQGGAA
jgi:hypothetical protein